MMKKVLYLSLLALFVYIVNLNAQISITPNKYFVSSGETLQVYVNINENQARDIYIALITPSNIIFSFEPDSNIDYGIKLYGTFSKLNKTIFKYKFDNIPESLSGEYSLVIASVPHGTNLSKYSFSKNELKFSKFVLRSSKKRNEQYLNSYLKHISDKDKSYIYSLYVARLISVPQPELYLQSDNLFIETIMATPGTKDWFLNKKVADIMPDIMFTNQSSSAFGDGESFSMSIVNLDNYKAVPDYKIYPDNYPFLNWFDRRFQPINFTLRSTKENNGEITYLEKAVILYFIKKYKDKIDKNKLFIIYTENSKAFLFDGNKFFDYNGKEVSKDAIDSSVELIFNENSVWYPLMDRDDSKNDTNLKQLIEKLELSNNTPFLEDIESKFIDEIKKNVNFTIFEQKELTRLLAQGADFGLINNMLGFIPDKLNSNFNYFQSLSFNTNYLRVVASFLSPYADMLADILLKDGYSAMSEEFHKFNTWGGESWMCCYTSYTIDEGFRMDIGTCKDLSVYGAAIMEVTGKIWLRLHGQWVENDPQKYMHFYIYVPQDKMFIDNGYSESSKELNSEYVMVGSPYSGSADYSHIDILTTSEGYAMFYFLENGNYATNWSITGTYTKEKLLELLKEIFENAEPKPTFVVVDSNFNAIGTLDYSKGIEIIEKEYKYLELP